MHRTQNLSVSAADTTDDTSDVVVTPADILRGAARYLEIHGWTQGSFYDLSHNKAAAAARPFPPACVTGAIGMAAHGTRIESPTTCSVATARDFRVAFHYLSGYLTDHDLIFIDPDEIDGDSPFCWNDDADQSAETVIATLRAAADDYDRRHQPVMPADEPTLDERDEPLIDAGGYLPCGCHGSQREHSCGPRD